MPGKVDGHQHQGVGEQVHLLGPPLDAAVAGVHQAGVEEGGEAVDRPICLLVCLRPGHDHLHVEVDDLVAQPVEASKGQDVLDCDL